MEQSLLVGSLPQWVSATATCVGVGIAFVASRAWRGALKGKRSDDLLISVFDLTGRIGATRAAIVRHANQGVYGQQVDRLYLSLLEVEKYYVVARRSYPTLDEQRLSVLRNNIDRAVYSSGIMHETAGGAIESAHAAPRGYFAALQTEAEVFREHVRSIIS